MPNLPSLPPRQLRIQPSAPVNLTPVPAATAPPPPPQPDPPPVVPVEDDPLHLHDTEFGQRIRDSKFAGLRPQPEPQSAMAYCVLGAMQSDTGHAFAPVFHGLFAVRADAAEAVRAIVIEMEAGLLSITDAVMFPDDYGLTPEGVLDICRAADVMVERAFHGPVYLRPGTQCVWVVTTEVTL